MSSESDLIKIKEKAQDVYELAMAKNNAAVILENYCHISNLSDEQLKAKYNRLTRLLFDTGKQLRKEILGY